MSKLEKQIINDYRMFRSTKGIKDSLDATALKNNKSLLDVQKILGFN